MWYTKLSSYPLWLSTLFFDWVKIVLRLDFEEVKMYTEHRILTAEALSEFTFVEPEQVAAYLDVCLELGQQIAPERCQQVWSYLGGFLRLPEWRAERMAKVLLSWLDFARLPFDAADRKLATEIANQGCPVDGEKRQGKVSICDFPAIFGNRYFQHAEEIMVVDWLLDYVHSFNYRMQEYERCMKALNQAVRADAANAPRGFGAFLGLDIQAAPRSLAADALNPETLWVAATGQLPQNAIQKLLWDLNQSIRYNLHGDNEFGYEMEYVQPFTTMLNLAFGENHAAVYPFILTGGPGTLSMAQADNYRLCRELGWRYRVRYREVKPQAHEYKFLERAYAGEAAWRQTALYGYGLERLQQAVRLRNVVGQVVQLEALLPDGSAGFYPVGPQLERVIDGHVCREVEYHGGDPRSNDEAELKRQWVSIHRIELHEDGDFVVHTAEESQGDPPWYVTLIERGIRDHGRQESYAEYAAANETPWKPRIFDPLPDSSIKTIFVEV